MNKTEIPLKELLFYGNAVSMCWFLCSSTNKTNNAWIQSFNNAVQERNFLFDFTFCFFFTGYYKALFWRVCRDVSVIHIYKTLSSHSPNKDGKNWITSTIFFFSFHAASLLLHCCCCFTEFWNIPQIWTLTFSSRMLIFSCWRLSWSLCSVTALSSSVMLLSWLWITSWSVWVEHHKHLEQAVDWMQNPFFKFSVSVLISSWVEELILFYYGTSGTKYNSSVHVEALFC